MREGELSAVIVVPQGYAESVAAKQAPANVVVYTDPTQAAADGATRQLVGFVLSQVNQAASGQPPAVVPGFESVQTNDLSFISYLVPSILGMSLMQLGVFAAIPLVADREKLILKRLQATPLRRWQLVGSNVVMRLLIAIVQTAIIVGVGSAGVRRPGRGQLAPHRGVRAARVADVHRPRLRHRLVRLDRRSRPTG